MQTYTIAFFGHRQIEDIDIMEKSLTALIEARISEKEYVEFLVGRNGDFDRSVSSVIRTMQKRKGSENTAHVLVLPYMTAEYFRNQEAFEAYYDEIEIMDASAHFKNAITKRNRAMIDRADEIIFYLERDAGGAYDAYRYASEKGKNVKNIAIKMNKTY
ncbi:MAG: hypothetical protein IJ489_06225 [Clostridia bacterium]|nr:hypothetical protein [Clostridia bacterium]